MQILFLVSLLAGSTALTCPPGSSDNFGDGVQCTQCQMGEYSDISGLKYPQEIILTVANGITQDLGWSSVKVTYLLDVNFELFNSYVPDTDPDITKYPIYLAPHPYNFFVFCITAVPECNYTHNGRDIREFSGGGKTLRALVAASPSVKFCANCAMGKYSYARASTFCKTCQIGTYTSSVGMTTCTGPTVPVSTTGPATTTPVAATRPGVATTRPATTTPVATTRPATTTPVGNASFVTKETITVTGMTISQCACASQRLASEFSTLYQTTVSVLSCASSTAIIECPDYVCPCSAGRLLLAGDIRVTLVYILYSQQTINNTMRTLRMQSVIANAEVVSTSAVLLGIKTTTYKYVMESAVDVGQLLLLIVIIVVLIVTCCCCCCRQSKNQPMTIPIEIDDRREHGA